jgi:hypothetical protein
VSRSNRCECSVSTAPRVAMSILCNFCTEFSASGRRPCSKLITSAIRMRVALPVLALLGLLGSPPAQSAALPSTAPAHVAAVAAQASWQLTFGVSGGLAGLERSLEITSGGQLIATDRRRALRVSARVPSRELADIAATVGMLMAVDARRDSRCADCLVYRLEINGDNKHRVLTFDDVTLRDTTLEPLVTGLTSLLTRAFAGTLEKP